MGKNAEELKRIFTLLSEAYETAKARISEETPDVEPNMARDTNGRFIILDALQNMSKMAILLMEDTRADRQELSRVPRRHDLRPYGKYTSLVDSVTAKVQVHILEQGEYTQPGDFDLRVENFKYSAGYWEILFIADFFGFFRYYNVEFDAQTEETTLTEYRQHEKKQLFMKDQTVEGDRDRA